MNWRNKLNKKQRKHLTVAGMIRLSDVKKTRDGQREIAIDGKEVCHECRSIAATLGIE